MHHFCRSGITARDGAFASRYPTEVKEYCCENDNVTFSSSFGFSVSPAATYTLCVKQKFEVHCLGVTAALYQICSAAGNCSSK